MRGWKDSKNFISRSVVAFLLLSCYGKILLLWFYYYHYLLILHVLIRVDFIFLLGFLSLSSSSPLPSVTINFTAIVTPF